MVSIQLNQCLGWARGGGRGGEVARNLTWPVFLTGNLYLVSGKEKSHIAQHNRAHHRIQSLRNLALPKKVKRRAINSIKFSNSTHRYIPRRKENIHPYKNQWMDKENVVYTHTMEYYLAPKRDEKLIYAKRWRNPENMILSKKQDTKSYISYDSVYM